MRTSTKKVTLLQRALEEMVQRKDELGPTPLAPLSVRRARDMIHERFADDVTLGDLAQAVGLSRHHLLRSFHRALGLPPHQYLMHVRVARARALLAAGVPATEVAHHVGFCDQSHLNRWFKRLLGMTPGMFSRTCAPTRQLAS
ncbi:MAG: Transcriptional regulator, AraC family [Labilithrix sp.]|nr:Transcriptional regulator, AraC family [Labilithrix sp.]